MRLHALLAARFDLRVDSSVPDVEIHGLTYNSRAVRPGSLFVAVPSATGGPGGARYIAEAVARGAVAVVARPDTQDAGVPMVRVPDPRGALAELGAEWYGHPSRRLRLFGVTGTDGKTTTTYLLEGILRARGQRTGLIGTVETRIGAERRTSANRMTTPESLDLQRLLREMVDVGITDAVMEVSSHALALERVRACRFEAVGLTNVTADHVEFHGSHAAYVAAKRSLFDRYAAGRPAVVPLKGDAVAEIARAAGGPLLRYGLEGESDLRAHDLRADAAGASFTIVYGSKRTETRVPMLGEFNVLNALAATGLAVVAGVSLCDAGESLRGVEPPPGRMERIDAGQPFTVVIDYAHTPHALGAVLAELRRQTPGHLIAVFGAAGNRDRAKRPLLARIARTHADFFYITDEDPCDEDPRSIMDQIAAGVPPAERGRRFELEPSRKRAIAAALDRARPGDTVIITGKGHERSIQVAELAVPWSDAGTVRQLLER